MLETVQDSHYY